MSVARTGLYSRSNPYPLPRTDRGSGVPIIGGQLPIPVPNVFNWSGHVRNAGADLHAIVSSRRIVGPAFIDRVEWVGQLGAGTTRSPKFIFGWTTSVIADQNDAADAVLNNVTPLVEQDFQDDGGFSAAGKAGMYSTQANPLSRTNRLGVALQAPEFFLIAAVRDDAAAGAFIVDFTARVLENVDPDMLAELIVS